MPTSTQNIYIDTAGNYYQYPLYVNDNQTSIPLNNYTVNNGTWKTISDAENLRIELVDYINFLHELLNIPFTYDEFKSMDLEDRKKVLRDKIIENLEK